jgi:epoxide hydrolase-like predicted phosphatase
MVIKAIIFDCFGVLVVPGRTLLYQSYPQLTDEISDLEHQSDFGMLSRQQFNEAIAELINTTPEEADKCYWATNALNEPVVDMIRDLKSSGKYQIGMLSNIGRGYIDDFFAHNKQDELFDAVLLSSEVGILKPDPAIFEIMAERLGVNPSECVMIDDIAVNIDGAENAGMTGVVFKSVHQLRSDLDNFLKSQHA